MRPRTLETVLSHHTGDAVPDVGGRMEPSRVAGRAEQVEEWVFDSVHQSSKGQFP